MLDYKLLQALSVVVQEGGFDKAAQQLHITQSAVSQRIKQLEEQTGQIVIARTNPPKPTPAGLQMIKHFRQVKRLEDDLYQTITPSDTREFTSLSIGTNRDCLTTWLQEALQSFLIKRRVAVEFRAADQEETHELMKDGKVIGCISVKDQPIQGCLVEYLGTMDYWLVSTPTFQRKWFKQGLNKVAISKAPLILFDRRDEMHTLIFNQLLAETPQGIPVYYVPSTKTYSDFIMEGIAYGLLPVQECGHLVEEGLLVNLSPATPVNIKLYWHCWNIKSKLLKDFTSHLVKKAKLLLLE